MSVVAVLLLLLMAVLGAPLFSVFGASSLALFGAEGSTTSVAVNVFGERFAESPTLITLPLFTFAGYVLAESGTPRRLVRVSRALFGWLPGGLAVVCLVASAFFTTFTGGSGITIVAIGGLLYPALLSERYRESFSLGLVTTGGSLGLLFPPSIPIILYGVIAPGVLIDKLFLAGLIPGFITVGILSLYAVARGWRLRPEAAIASTGFLQFLRFVGAAVAVLLLGVISANALDLTATLLLPVVVLAYFVGAFATTGETRAALVDTSWEVLLPVVLVAGLLNGVLKIDEAAAFTALYVLVIEIVVYRDITLTGDVPRIIRESMTMLGAILIILCTALGFTEYLIDAQVPDLMVDWMEGFIDRDSPWMFLLALNVFLLIVGMLMDIFSAIVVVVPLIAPIAAAFGVDPYHLGIVFLLNLEIGYLTPPVGLNLFIASFRFKKPVTQLYGAVLPYIGLLGIALILTTYVPWFSTVLTRLDDRRALDSSVLDTPGEGEEMPGGFPQDEEGSDGTESLDDLLDEGGGGETLDDLLGGGGEGETLDDLDFGGETLEDLEGSAREGETLDDLLGPAPEGETLDDLEDAP
jgi:C4-dicarboxylate transporter DctM subunit